MQLTVITCPHCKKNFSIGIDEKTKEVTPNKCPNCKTEIEIK